MPSGPAASPSAWIAFWRGVTTFQKSKINVPMAMRNTIGVAAPLAAGAAFGHLGAGLIMSTGALQVAFRDSDGPYRDRARFMLAASVIAGIAVALGSMAANHPTGSVALATAWAFASGMLVALGQQAGELGLMSLVLLVIYAAIPLPVDRAALAGVGAFAGGVLQTALAVANWTLDPYAPVRRALGDLYLAISRRIVSPAKASEAPLASDQSVQAQNALKGLAADSSAECDRFRILLSQAERLRPGILALARVRVRLERDFHVPDACEILDRAMTEISRITGAIGETLQSGGDPALLPVDANTIERPAEELRGRESGSADVATLINDARTQLDAIAGQLRSALDVMKGGAAQAGSSAPAPKPKVSLLRDRRLLTLRANLSFESPAFRHAVRLAACIFLGDTIAHAAGVIRPYWLPMTVAIVLRPDFGTTFSRGVLRLIGTFAGILLATGLVHALPQTVWPHIAMIAVLMFIMRSFGAANYGVFATAVTAMVVFLVWLNGVAPGPAMTARALSTAAGGTIALVAYWIWPTWERHQVSETMARMLDGFAVYLSAVREHYVNRTTASGEKLERARVAGRLARTNFEASAARAVAEPGVSRKSADLLTAMLASSHRLVQALMALEAAIQTSQGVRPREAFHKFAHDLTTTLQALAAALRGNPGDPRKLPDLREDHHALVHSGESGGVYALVNVETDRITNALNTLAGEVMEWTSPGEGRVA